MTVILKIMGVILRLASKYQHQEFVVVVVTAIILVMIIILCIIV